MVKGRHGCAVFHGVLVTADGLKSPTEEDSDDGIKGDIPPTQRSGLPALKKPSSLTTKRKFFFGLIIVCLIAISWVGGTQTVTSSFNTGFNAPFFLMYFSTAWMMLVFPLTAPVFFLSGKGSWDLSGLKELWRYAHLFLSTNECRQLLYSLSACMASGYYCSLLL